MRKLFFAMLALAALASCSKDEVVQLNQDEIRYNVVAENTTKAAAVYCNNNKITTFNVWAKVGNVNYIGGSGDVVTSPDNGTTWTSNIKRYWPDGDVDFYAVAGMANNTITWAPGTVTPASFTYTVLGDVADQEDVLYAYEQAEKPVNTATTTGTVNLNFRHALSQVVFNAKNQHPNLYIEISEVQVCGLTNSGTFNYPSSETTTNNSDAENPHVAVPSYPAAASVGSWNVSTVDANKDKSYSVVISPAAMLNPKTTAEDVTADLTAVYDDGKEFSTKAMLLLPQSQTAYDGSTGTFFKIKCKIFNVADNTVDASSYVKTQLFGGVNGDYAYIPFSFTWEPGKKYIYTFVFGNDTNGGVEGDGEKPDLDNPVLVNIGYTISIDEFVPVSATADWTTNV